MKAIREYLIELLKYIGYLEDFTAQGLDTLKNDIKTELAVRQAYEIIGEIVKRLPDSLLEQQSHIRWKDIKGFRDVLIHQYNQIDLDIVWEAIEDLPNLRAAVEDLLAGLDTESEE